MRSFKEFQKELEMSHNCEKCHGKIIVIKVDKLGNQYCGYCGEKVNYPTPTTEEILRWVEEKDGT